MGGQGIRSALLIFRSAYLSVKANLDGKILLGRITQHLNPENKENAFKKNSTFDSGEPLIEIGYSKSICFEVPFECPGT